MVNRQHVVTAGHCIKNKNIEDLTVTLGEYNIAESYDAQERYPSETYKVAAMVVHPGFKFSPAADRSDSREARFTSSSLIFPFYRRFDVAVLQLSSPVSYMSHIAPICLPQVGRDPEVASLRSEVSSNFIGDQIMSDVCYKTHCIFSRVQWPTPRAGAPSSPMTSLAHSPSSFPRSRSGPKCCRSVQSFLFYLNW